MQKGLLIDRKILDLLGELENVEIAKNLLELIEYKYKQKIITLSFFKNNLDKVYEIISSYKGNNLELIKFFFNNLGIILPEETLRDNENINLSSEKRFNVKLTKVYQNRPKKIEVRDFVNNFRNRFNSIRAILQERIELDNLLSISRINGKNSDKGNHNSFSIIAMVFDKRTTKNGNIILEIEDLTGRISALITKNKIEVFEKSKELLLDEVIALKCSYNGEILFVTDLFFPDIKLLEKKKSQIDEIIAFISDIHVGSNKFLESNFERFIEWINGNIGTKEQREEALKVKYLFITGDCVDGVGVYPDQESQLIIKDVNEQYKKLSSMLLRIRDDLKMILCAGQHDAVRVAEPQPIIGEFFGQSMKEVKNLYLVTNPSLIEVGAKVQFKVLMYHGASMHGIINEIEKLRLGKSHDSPTEVVKYMLKKRHLAPSHSLVTYTPLEKEDALMINEIPDIVVTGDLHRPEVSEYNGVLLISGSCWQARTPFEEKVGNNPDPCKVPLFNMKTREVKIIDFSDGIKKGGENAD